MIQKKPLITILTVNYKTSDFLELMLYSFSKLTHNYYKVLICDNYSTDKEIIKLSKISQKYENIEIVFRQQTSFGSIGHAEAMDILVSMVTTPYFVTMDSDALFLTKDWDKKILNKMVGKIKVIGTALPQTTKSTKPIDFPLVFAVFYETETFKELNPSFMPGNLVKDKSKDTGWEIRDKYIKNNIENITFNSINTRFNNTTPFKNLLCALYYLDDELIVSHFGRGSSGGVNKYNNKWWLKIPFISKILKKYIGLKEKKEWIKICYQIINEEVVK